MLCDVLGNLGCLVVLPGRESSTLGGLSGPLLSQNPWEKVEAPHLLGPPSSELGCSKYALPLPQQSHFARLAVSCMAASYVD